MPGKPDIAELGLFSRAVLAIATFLALAATGVMILEGLSRFVLNVSYFWAEETVRFLFVWAFFLTLGIAGFKCHHIRTELLVQSLPLPVQRLIWVLSGLTGMAFAAILVYSSFSQLHGYYLSGFVSESSLEIPMWIIFMVIPLGGVALLGYYGYATWYAVQWGDPFTPRQVEVEADQPVLAALSKEAAS